ncbi:hypothetical protein [Parasitella parasitica]|uniref:MULE transposase domain-containing protein n=1 Tax=Parasitella parasitica TaxID=35722 RepID=A0A0B7NHE7_9FUNG|nr:hypothetical protein [Parasitella parasitica]
MLISVSTDKEKSLMTAIEAGLTNVKHLLCRWHKSKNVLVHINKIFDGLEPAEVTRLLKNWNFVVTSRTEQAFEDNLINLVGELPRRNEANEYLHLKSSSTPRIEGAHAILERHLKSSAGNLGYVFNCMDTVLKQQHTEINVRPKAQQYKANNQIRTPAFSGILRSISRHPL